MSALAFDCHDDAMHLGRAGKVVSATADAERLGLRFRLLPAPLGLGDGGLLLAFDILADGEVGLALAAIIAWLVARRPTVPGRRLFP